MTGPEALHVTFRGHIELIDALVIRLEGHQRGKVELSPLETRAVAEAVRHWLAAAKLVEEQAKDEALWCPVTAVEAYTVQELRKLHAAIEGEAS